ncbi:MAG TPA: 1,4-alpha-glucan branching protein GlgB [Casimicrobiaceae bacterium]|nr:1,4-alpha-glucan branching protein GlgB [Casimicrobiaceae bacterium]
MRGPVPGEQDLYLFREGSHTRLFDFMGCHLHEDGASFRVWAPNARGVAVIGEWNGWNPEAHPLAAHADGSGLWQGFVPGVARGQTYKYRILPREGEGFDKADPFGVLMEAPPSTASRAWTIDYAWGDEAWMAERAKHNALDAPMSIYEVHLGSWRRDGAGTLPTYRDIAEPLAQYAVDRGFTHVELMPVTEHPFYGSWGYQTTGYFAPTARYGTPEEFMHLVDVLHRHGIGVILDWVPSHFPDDPHGLARFDGTHLYEHEDPRQGFHPDWKSLIFNYSRHEVRSFLLSSALYWLSRFHVDGLRVDAVASMLYLDYGRDEGEWIPNEHGGRENLGAVRFLQQLNEAVYRDHPDVQVIAEESTAWPRVSRPVYLGGLGFGMKWNMGWMHDTLAYMREQPVHRKWHHDKLTFSIWYAFTENFVLPLSHDEVVHGKGSLVNKMPGDSWQQFANLRALFGYMWGHPGKKLLFMGSEFGQRREWAHEEALEWFVLEHPEHAGVQRWVSDLNALLRSEPALHERDFASDGFEWVDARDADASVVSFLRKPRHGAPVLVVCNFTPMPRTNYVVGVPVPGHWRELLNSDATLYGGSGMGNFGGVESAPVAAQGRFHSLALTLPPLSVMFFKPMPR